MYVTATVVTEFVNSIPTTTNPFLATSDFFGSLITPPPMPTWSRVVIRLCVGGYAIMFLQSMFLLGQRVRLNSFKALHFNKLGLLTVRVSDPTAILLSIYAAVTICFLSLLLIEENPEYVAGYGVDMALFQCKFLVLLPNAWAFLWVSSCHCAVLLWDSNFVSNLSNGKRDILRATLKWGMSTFFLVGIILPFPLIISSCVRGYKTYLTSRSIVHELRNSLILASYTFNPETYNKLRLLTLLTSAQKLVPLQHELELCIRFQIRLGEIFVAFLSFICVPCLFFALSSFYKQTDVNGSPPTQVNLRIARARKQLVSHALAVYLSEAIGFPVLVWLDCRSSTGFEMDTKWREVCFHGLTAPFCITGNIIAFVLNWHTRDHLREIQRGPREVCSEFISEESELSTASSGICPSESSIRAKESTLCDDEKEG